MLICKNVFGFSIFLLPRIDRYNSLLAAPPFFQTLNTLTQQRAKDVTVTHQQTSQNAIVNEVVGSMVGASLVL